MTLGSHPRCCKFLLRGWVLGLRRRFSARCLLCAGLSLHTELIVEFETLCQEVCNSSLALWDVAINFEFPIVPHVVNRVELVTGCQRGSCQVTEGRKNGYTFMLYGYNSLAELTPPEFFTSNRQRFRVDSWLYTGRRASDTGSDSTMR